MKQLTSTIGIILLIAAVAVPVLAWGPGNHMMGYGGWGNDYGRSNSQALTPGQQDRLETLDRQFYDETRELRTQLQAQYTALDTELNKTDPDIAEIRAIQKDISRLRATLDEKSVEYEVEAGKIVPEARSRKLGFHHMGPYNRGSGYGPGYCWNR
ncbi:MAG: periplasmic heavy metal sensor [Thermodesulfobacteriota bacterium]|nr:periplasmic heavy metal sensor [Thermodesulfobacteriota bacterium]